MTALPPIARVYIGLGSNMGDKQAAIAEALLHLDTTPHMRVAQRAGNYLTPPWGDTDQDWFVNTCAALETSLAPDDVLAACLAIENRMGRVRTRHWGPRVIDIDLLDYAGIIVSSDNLTLPHPRILERAFVLAPLAEIAPDLIIQGQRIGEAALKVQDPQIKRMPAP